MFAEFFDNPELSDVTLSLVGAHDEMQSVRAHMMVLYSHAKDHFKTLNEHDRKRKREMPEDEEDEEKKFADNEFRIVGWKHDLRAARDFVQFMYCAFDATDTTNAWGDAFLETADVGRLHALMCTAHAHGAKRVVDACMKAFVVKISLDGKFDWDAFFQMPRAILDDARIQDAVWKPLARGMTFQRVYMDLAELSWPVEHMIAVLESDDLKIWSEDVVLEFVLISRDRHLSSQSIDWTKILTCVRVARLTLKGLQVLLRSPLSWLMTNEDRGRAETLQCLGTNKADLPLTWKTPRSFLQPSDLSVTFGVEVDVKTLKHVDAPFATIKPVHIPFVEVEFVYWRIDDGLFLGVKAKSSVPFVSMAGRVHVEYTDVPRHVSVSCVMVFDAEDQSRGRKFADKTFENMRMVLHPNAAAIDLVTP